MICFERYVIWLVSLFLMGLYIDLVCIGENVCCNGWTNLIGIGWCFAFVFCGGLRSSLLSHCVDGLLG